MNETELRALIVRSEKEGFRELFREYRGYVYTIVWNRIGAVGTREDAEETVNDVFAQVFRHFGEIRDGSLRGYIGTVAKCTAIDAFRRLASQVPTVLTEEENMPDIPDPTDIVSDQEHAALRRHILSCIESLGQPDASILLQKYYYDRSYAEIARSVQMHPAAVRMRASRALKRLRRLLDDQYQTRGGA